MDTEAPSTVWLLWTLLLETSGCRCPGISLHLYLWGKSPTVQLLGRRAGLFLTLWGTSTQFSRVAAPGHIPTNSARVFPFLRILPNICGFLPCWFSPILTGVTCYLIVLRIPITLMASDVEHFLMCLLTMSMSSSDITSFLISRLIHSLPLNFSPP